MGVGAMAYLVIRRKGVLDLALVYVVLDDMIPADDRVHGPTAISSQFHSSRWVPLREASPHSLCEFCGVSKGNLVQEGAALGSVFGRWGWRSGRSGVAGGSSAVGAAQCEGGGEGGGGGS